MIAKAKGRLRGGAPKLLVTGMGDPAGVSRHLNVEVKARCADPEAVLARLRELGAIDQGVDHQVDTYFGARSGRLKLRAGDIENHLIHYQRPDRPGPGPSAVTLYPTRPNEAPELGELLAGALGVLVVVDKQRHILWIGDVKFHVDQVEGLGSFVEIEAVDRAGTLGEDRLRELCYRYVGLLGISEVDLEARSYSDLLGL